MAGKENLGVVERVQSCESLNWVVGLLDSIVHWAAKCLANVSAFIEDVLAIEFGVCNSGIDLLAVWM